MQALRCHYIGLQSRPALSSPRQAQQIESRARLKGAEAESRSSPNERKTYSRSRQKNLTFFSRPSLYFIQLASFVHFDHDLEEGTTLSNKDHIQRDQRPKHRQVNTEKDSRSDLSPTRVTRKLFWDFEIKMVYF